MSTLNRLLLLIFISVLPLFVWSLHLRAKPVATRSHSPAPVGTVTPSPLTTPFAVSGGEILDGASTD